MRWCYRRCQTGKQRVTLEFKLEAARLDREHGASVPQSAADLGFHANLLRKRVRSVKAHREHRFPGQGRMGPEGAEVARLWRQLGKASATPAALGHRTATAERDRVEAFERQFDATARNQRWIVDFTYIWTHEG